MKSTQNYKSNRSRIKLQWLQNLSQTKGDNRKNVRRETNITFWDRKREYLKEINNLEKGRTKISGIYIEAYKKFKKGYQPRNKLVKDDD
jgi:hypothetical protein